MDQNVLHTLASLREKDTLTDCTIETRLPSTAEVTSTWRVHRLVLAMHSDKVLSEVKEKLGGPGEYILPITCYDLGGVDCMITFIYTLEYDDGRESWCPLNDYEDLYDRLYTDRSVHSLATRYDLPTLQTKAREKAATLLASWSAQTVKDKSDFLSDMVDLFYGEGIVVGWSEVLVQHLLNIAACSDDSSIREEVLELASQNGEFARDLISELGRRA